MYGPMKIRYSDHSFVGYQPARKGCVFREEMFKKRKDKTKQDVLTVDNKKQEDRSSIISANSSFVADENGNGQITFADQVDGFDSQGFVDLTPAENQPKLLGPKQVCQVCYYRFYHCTFQ